MISGHGNVKGIATRADTGEGVLGAQIELFSFQTVPTTPLRLSGLIYAYFASNLKIVGDDPQRVLDLVANRASPDYFSFSDAEGNFDFSAVPAGEYVLRVFWFNIPEDLGCLPGPTGTSLFVNQGNWVTSIDGSSKSIITAPAHSMPFSIEEGELLTVDAELGC